MITSVEGEGQSRQMAELRLIVLLTGVGMLMEVVAQAQVGECVCMCSSAPSLSV